MLLSGTAGVGNVCDCDAANTDGAVDIIGPTFVEKWLVYLFKLEPLEGADEETFR